jgi:hypothetical protein
VWLPKFAFRVEDLIGNNLKVKGLVVKLPKFNRIFMNCFQIGKIVHRVHGSGGPAALSVYHGPTPLLRSELPGSSASGRSRARGHQLRVRGGGGGVGEPFGGLT